jgi:hypothetical protein
MMIVITIFTWKYALFYFTVETFIRLNDYRMESTILSHYYNKMMIVIFQPMEL